MSQIFFQNDDKPIDVKTIYCIGRNYAAHAKELNNPIPKTPMVFTKPLSSLMTNEHTIILPAQSQNVHHELEVVVLIQSSGKNILVADAQNYIGGYAIGIDVTARDIQETAKAKGHPWTTAKGFDTFAPVSKFISPNQINDLQKIPFSMTINQELRQKGNTENMLFSIPELIAYLSTCFTLQAGDLIFTGTPEGVGQLNPADQISAELDGNCVSLLLDVK